ncbi:hypothetical protein F5878DRAFT_192173 [Lentinula raphanica]|uniref:Uncharacterized protein n=1 Tax=Lentinula raphanica TaxID=153919 RepID=A0AA38P8F1_9AGAR|nr:hypothetical protein F5878DRAFT_192173 [Lentinula raphanica]
MFIEMMCPCHFEQTDSMSTTYNRQGGTHSCLRHLAAMIIQPRPSPYPGKPSKPNVLQSGTSTSSTYRRPRSDHPSVASHSRRCNHCGSTHRRSSASSEHSSTSSRRTHERRKRRSTANDSVNSKDSKKSNTSFIRSSPTDENSKRSYYMQGTMTENPLQPRSDIVSFSWSTYVAFSFEPYGFPEGSISDDNRSSAALLDSAHDPRDPIVEQTSKRTIRRQREHDIEKLTATTNTKPSWTPKPAKSLGLALHWLEKLAKK